MYKKYEKDSLTVLPDCHANLTWRSNDCFYIVDIFKVHHPLWHFFKVFIYSINNSRSPNNYIAYFIYQCEIFFRYISYWNKFCICRIVLKELARQENEISHKSKWTSNASVDWIEITRTGARLSNYRQSLRSYIVSHIKVRYICIPRIIFTVRENRANYT